MSHGRKALVVDDDAGVRLLLKRILFRNDFDVDLAGDGAAAIEKILANDYAVIVLDLMMPRIDGRGVIRYLSNNMPEKLPNVIVVSAFGASALAEVTPSVSRFLEKPFDIDRLVREVTEVVTSRGRSGSEGRPEADAPR
jgi:two-component system response regulator MprA